MPPMTPTSIGLSPVTRGHLDGVERYALNRLCLEGWFVNTYQSTKRVM